MELVVELIDAKAQGISFDGPPKRHEEFTNRIRGMFGYDGPAIRLDQPRLRQQIGLTALRHP